jgi:hypothetical protein
VAAATVSVDRDVTGPPELSEHARIHRDNLERTLSRIWLAMTAAFGAQWFWISTAENAGAGIQVLTFGYICVELIAVVSVFKDLTRATTVVGLLLCLAFTVAVTILAMANRAALFGRHGAVGDGLLLLLAPALSAYAGFGVRARLIAPCSIVAFVSLMLAMLAPTGALSLGLIPYEQGLWSIANLVVVWSVTRFLRRGARQADRLSEQAAQLEARTRAAGAAVLADQRAVSIVHDLVIHALLALSRPVSTGRYRETGRLVDGAIDGLAGRTFAQEADDSDVDLDALLRADARQWSSTLHLTLNSGGAVVVPASVADAVVGAVKECLRNVVRHAHTTNVTIAVSFNGFLQVQVRDDGAGFEVRAPVPGHFGVSRSIVGRLQSVGGFALIDSLPGEGTRVTLRWAPLDLPDSPDELSASDAAWSWVQRLGLSLRSVWLTYFAPSLAVTVVLAFLHLPDARSAPLALTIVAVQVGISFYAAGRAARLRLSLASGVVLLVVNAALVAIGIDMIAPGTQDGYAYWVIGGAVSSAAVIALLRPIRESLPATVVLVSVISASISQSSTGGTIGAVTVVLLGVLIAVAHRRAFERLNPISENYLTQLSEARAAAERLTALRSVEEQRIAPVRRRILPFLRAAKEDDGMLADAEFVLRAAALHRWARQHLELPEFFDDRVGQLLDAAEDNGIEVDIIGENPRGGAVSVGRRLLEFALQQPHVTKIKLSFIPSTAEATDLLLLVVCRASIPDTMISNVEMIDSALSVTATTNLLCVKWTPEPASRAAVSAPTPAATV